MSRPRLRASISGHFDFKKALPIVFPAACLLVLFSFTSAFLFYVPPWWLGNGLNQVIINIVVWGMGVGYVALLNPGGVASALYLDFLSLALLVTLFLAIRKNSSTLRAVEICSLLLSLLPGEIWATDRSEFNIHVTTYQSYFGILQGFTNADLLYCTGVVFAAAVIIDMWRRASRSGAERLI